MSTDEKIKDRIRKLLEMTEGRGCTEAEAMVALEKAQKLLLAHNLTEVDIKGFRDSADHRESGRSPDFAWVRKINQAVAKLYDCRYIEGKDRERKNSWRTTFVGRQSNAETACLIADFAVRSVRRMAEAARKEIGATSSYATSFCHGCAERVEQKAHELWREANRDAIEAKELVAQAERDRRREFQPDPWNLEDGTYEIETLTRRYLTRRLRTLTTPEAQVYLVGILREPPEGVYVVGVKCTVGRLACDETYYFRVRDEERKPGRRLARDVSGFRAGTEAGDRVGLRVQVGAATSTVLDAR